MNSCSGEDMDRKHIETIEGLPVIGETYFVRSIEVHNGWDRPTPEATDWWSWVPVIGNSHEDKELLNVEWQHYHVDFRFCTDDQLKWFSHLEDTNVSQDKIQQKMFTFAYRADCTRGRPVYRECVCFRQMPDFPVMVYDDSRYEPVYFHSITEKIEKAYTDKTLNCKSKCLRCPHRGLPLNGIPDRNGTVVCPGHGLRWDTKTGKMVSRLHEADLAKAHNDVVRLEDNLAHAQMDMEYTEFGKRRLKVLKDYVAVVEKRVKETIGE